MEIILFPIYIALVVLWIWSLVDILKSEFKGNEKILWLFVVLFLNAFGAILYFFIGKDQKIS
ncbi:MAG: Unknown protein [uncultured Campylobacterales bacterium]|uniref:Cardiolipin synthase N-terminal domain-containing protein n=1 Tax=uncultured Campylobacterales bacterium TaxID=352960 RepID=A0A6S6SGU3_9BACT|nr:MAG: Unknown protein [uncultured Campylobacterales bacterium]